MQELTSLTAAPRAAGTKGHARRLRASGMLPGVMYGKNAEPTAVAVNPKETAAVLSTEYGFNKVFNLDVDGASTLVMVKDYQFDPIRRELTHLDFYAVDPEQFVTLRVPVSTTGASVGVKAGGRLQIVSRDVKLTCRVKDIPSTVPHDVTTVHVGESVYVDEMIAPEGCEFVFKNRYPVIRVARKRGAKVRGGEEAAVAE